MTGSDVAGPHGGISLPFDDARHLAAHRWLVDEMYLLDAQDYESWLNLLADDIDYVMPVRVTTPRGAGFDSHGRMTHFSEDKFSLNCRVARFATQHAWAEDPASRFRHHLTNVRAFATDDEDSIRVESGVLLYRSRGDVIGSCLLSAGRVDVLRQSGDAWLLARRRINVDDSVLPMQNLAFFL